MLIFRVTCGLRRARDVSTHYRLRVQPASQNLNLSIIELPFDIYVIIAIQVTDVITLRNDTSTQLYTYV